MQLKNLNENDTSLPPAILLTSPRSDGLGRRLGLAPGPDVVLGRPEPRSRRRRGRRKSGRRSGLLQFISCGSEHMQGPVTFREPRWSRRRAEEATLRLEPRTLIGKPPLRRRKDSRARREHYVYSCQS